MTDLGPLKISRRSGTEPFLQDGVALPIRLLDFWQWSNSDLASNVFRGVLAEFLVATALGLADGAVRTEWDGCDLRTPDGVLVEVKSAAYLQSWAQKRRSSIAFDIRERAWAWDSATDSYTLSRCRTAHVYVFCLLHHLDKATLNPLDVGQWTFYVLPTAALPPQKTLSLSVLEALGGVKTEFHNLAEAVRSAASA